MATSRRIVKAALGDVGQCLLAFAGLGLVIVQDSDSRLGQLDQAVIKLVGSERRPAAVRAARAISALAEPEIAAAALVVAAVIAARREGWRTAVMPCLAVASGMRSRRILSSAVARPRPPEPMWLTEPEGFSLPSKHTSVAALTAGACAVCLGARRGARYDAAAVAAVTVGVSRVYLGVHWPSDVLAGWLFAEGWLHLAGACQGAYRLFTAGHG